jgi:hypothetical protein
MLRCGLKQHLQQAELREIEKKKHEEAFQFQKRTNEQLKNQLESMLAPGKK